MSWRAASSVRTCSVTLAGMRVGLIALLHVAIAPQQVHNREVGRRLAIGHRGAFQEQAPWRVVGVGTLVDRVIQFSNSIPMRANA